MRLLSLGAFAYPHHQGSQVYFQEQAIALRAAGADVELLTYGSGLAPGRDLDRWRALDGFVHHKTPGWSAPRDLTSGPGPGKPLADLALAHALRRVVATARPFEAILAHNAEAALVALHALPRGAPPVLYCVHTLLEHELSAYLGAGEPSSDAPLRSERAVGAARRSMRRGVDGLGRRIDRHLARRSDGWLALAPSAATAMRRQGTAPGVVVPPPLPDPRPALDGLEAEAIVRRHRLEPGRFFLYSGNLDGYQALALLARVAVAKPGGEGSERGGERSEEASAAETTGGVGAGAPLPIVVASHDARVARDAGLPSGLVGRHVETSREMNALLSLARASLVPRRARGGFPIKLVNSLALGTPVVSSLGRDWGLEHEVDGLIYSSRDETRGLAGALTRLAGDDELVRCLRSGARARFEAEHEPQTVARRTLDWIEHVTRAPA